MQRPTRCSHRSLPGRVLQRRRARPCGAPGFSRFEALVVLIVMAVLVALALPRLASSRGAARQVLLKSLMATTQSTANLFHLRCEASRGTQPEAAADCRELLMQGQKVVGVHGWPAASLDGIAAAVNSWGEPADIDWRPERIDGQPALRARLRPTDVAGTCEFIYAQAASPGAAPRIELIDASCP